MKITKPSKTLDHASHWRGMPEFSQEEIKPFKSIIVHFETAEDYHKFSKMISQPLTIKTKYIYYPQQVKLPFANLRYVDKKKSK